MKRIWIILLFLLLTGCCREEAPVIRAAPDPAASREPAAFTALPECRWERIIPMGEDLLLTGSGTLSRISGQTLATTAKAEVASSFTALQVWEDFVSYYDPQSRETVLLNSTLESFHRIPAPGDITGQPLLSRDRKSLFYCTETGIFALDPDTGVRRMLKEDASPEKSLEALLLSDSVLCCRYSDPVLGDRFCFLSTETGRTLLDRAADLTVSSQGDIYYAALGPNLLFGKPGQQPNILVSENQGSLLPQWGGALTWQLEQDGQITLRCYHLESGKCVGQQTLSAGPLPRAFAATEEGIVWFLRKDEQTGLELLHRWDLSGASAEDETIHTALYYTAENPDAEGLERCAGEALRIGQRFGIRVLIWTEAAAAEPWDYTLEPEHRVPELTKALQLLEKELAKYPSGFLKILSEGCGSLSLCLVRSICPSANNPAATNAQGLQFRLEGQSFLVFSTQGTRPRTLHHELYHLIDSRILTFSSAFDSWDSLNPGDFAYDYDYQTNKNRDGSPFLKETSRSFIDTYSMSFPGEDRARIMEYAMEPGNASLFSAPILQQKLTAVCTGIREAFGLQNHPPLPWEQYLLKPLAPASRE